MEKETIMNSPHRALTWFALLLAAAALAKVPPARAQDAGATQPAKPDGNKPKEEKGEQAVERSSVTEHDLTIKGQTLHYRATAGMIVLKDDAGKPKADMFYVAYEKLPAKSGPTTRPANAGDGKEPQASDRDGKSETSDKSDHTAKSEHIEPATRPLTFVFNGGPGAAAVWLHLGAGGPKRVKLTETGEAPPPPYGLEDNPATWLDFTDMVFIDPVGTGYSRPAPGEKQEQFSGVQEDISAVGEFIRLWTTRNQRWASPKFLAGESYGTTRAAGLSDYLLDRHGIALNGITFISTVLNFQTISFGRGNELPYVLYLPSYAATAHYFKKLPPDLQSDLTRTLKEVERWSIDAYLPALAKGHALVGPERADVTQKLSRYTGLSADVVEKADLRIDPGLFRKALLEDRRELLGRYDARLTGYESDPLERSADFDPSFNQYLAAYSAAFNQYVRGSLHFDSDRHYEALSGRVGQWNFGRSGNGYLDVADNLQSAMRKNPHLRVLFASGLYDFATPYFGTTYTANHFELSPSLRQHVEQTFYPSGHMVYHHRPSAERLHDDMKAFVDRATHSATVAGRETDAHPG
jgi:carboxypeptidase C (cathepsin A)